MTTDPRPDLLGFRREELAALLSRWGEPAFRAKQLYRHLHVHLAASFEQMTDLPRALRERLHAETRIGTLACAAVRAADGGLTRKALFQLPDGSPVESVLMVYPDRATVCVSSQSGCPMACVFCATGKLGFLHDLTPGQIVEQVYWAARLVQHEPFPVRRLTNVVFMGMGEPFNNYANWRAAVELLHDPEGFNMGARSFTVSTVGLIPGIRRLADDPLPINLAISLHAPNDELRTEMMPVNKSFPIADLLEAVREYTEKTGRRVSFEYVLLQEKNDSTEQAKDLGRLLRASGIRPELMHVNLIPWNPVPGTPLSRSHRNRVRAFQAALQSLAIPCTVRVERGVEIGAACGQLAGEAPPIMPAQAAARR
ncbi:MAG: 23S rRNA (adenine(2503)-C(2))-methyltransferase RlmN [Kiritimatiellae bacterium]|nr:23S rRNA (adenine(2503)-C(2))-methyltransferase RlmN [Kiritimatiellia bacterium]MDW8458886.1 23S rRNA (adenine(2503)-C(2))-methyltransferase RlmN [Verrucomicrobiota bacterium]